MTTYLVRAERAGRCWELHISDGATHGGVTQVRHLWDAEVQVRDYLESLYERDTSGDRFLLYGEHIPVGQNNWSNGGASKDG